MKGFILLVTTLFLTLPALAGVQVFDGSTNKGVFNQLQCSSTGGLACAKVTGNKFSIGLAGTPQDAAGRTIFGFGWLPSAAADGTSTTASATVVYLSQIRLPVAVTLTGVGILNAATVGTNKYIVALFDSTGAKLANSALAGTLTAGASAYQKVAFTATKTVGPGTYWIGMYMNGTTDTYYAIPTLGQAGGLAGSVTGQTFGTVANVTLPTTFTADKGPISYVY